MQSWKKISVKSIFTVCRNMTNEGEVLAGSTVDSHMMKNTEWGAVAYLSRSKYGKNSEVWNNPYYSDETNFSPITGLCGTSEKVAQTNLTNTYRYNETNGGNASTTGNVYGVYDMAGGAWDCVAGILSSKISNGSNYDFSSINTKYYDSYDSYNDTKYGDAIYETSSGGLCWGSHFATFVSSTYPMFIRGGRPNTTYRAGIFGYTATRRRFYKHQLPSLLS